MDYSVFGRKNVTTRNRDDRFVLSRDYISEIRGRSWNSDSSSDLFNLSCSIGENLKRTRYADYLDRALGVAKAPGTQPERLWPCVPRRKGYLSTADNILDLPTYSSAIFPELLDWSKDNVVVAALGARYHKWSCSDQQTVSRMHTLHEIMCCKFDPRGELLLLGTHMRRVEIHNNARNKRENVVFCHGPLSATRREMHFYCSVTAVDWSPTGNSFVMGCSYGVVASVTRCAMLISCRRVVNEPVYLLRVSPDVRFVAVAAVNSTAVLLLTWPALKSHCTINADWMIKTITWHPWRSALLGVGAMTTELQACVATLHAPTGAVRARPLAPRNYGLDAMLFSERSGELVASLWSTERVSIPVYSQLVVLSDPETVVDQWGDGRSWPDRVRTMVFSPDGTKLATATIKEDLIIWNFLPEEKVQKKTRRKQFYSMPMYQDLATLGVSIR